MSSETNTENVDGTYIRNPYDHVEFPQRSKQPLPCCDGKLDIELSNRPIPYHISYCFPENINENACKSLALHSCRIATMSLDAVRGRIPTRNLDAYLTGSCAGKLETMACLLDNHMKTHPKLREQLCLLPVIPSMVHGIMVSPTNLEMVVGLDIGKLHYWASLVFKVKGNRWVCTLSDIG